MLSNVDIRPSTAIYTHEIFHLAVIAIALCHKQVSKRSDHEWVIFTPLLPSLRQLQLEDSNERNANMLLSTIVTCLILLTFLNPLPQSTGPSAWWNAFSKSTVVAADSLMKRDILRLPDPFAIVSVDGEQIHTTSVIKRTLNPYWNEWVSTVWCRNGLLG